MRSRHLIKDIDRDICGGYNLYAPVGDDSFVNHITSSRSPPRPGRQALVDGPVDPAYIYHSSVAPPYTWS